jgi:hypothetical protein
MLSLAYPSGIALGSLVVVGVLATGLGSIAAFVIVVIANRADPDASGKRPVAAYLFGTSFVTLLIAIAGILAAVFSLISLIGASNGPGFTFEVHPVGDAVARGVTVGLLLLITAGAAHYYHRARGTALAASEPDPASPTRRVERGYIALVSFISLIVVVLASFAALYSIASLIAPGVYQLASRTSGWKSLLDELTVIIVFGAVFWDHQGGIAPALRLIAPRRPTAAAPEGGTSET